MCHQLNYHKFSSLLTTTNLKSVYPILFFMKAALLASFVATASLATIATPAIAEEKDGKGWYGTAGVGFLSPNDPAGDECVTILGSKVCADYDYKFDDAFSGEVGVGYDFGKFRVEATYTRSNTSLNKVKADVSVDGIKYVTLSSKVDDGDANLNSFLINGYIDFETDSKFVPYVGGGIGYTKINFSSYTVKVDGYTVKSGEGSDSAFGYQAKAGVSYLASEKVDIFGEAIFSGTTGFNIDSASIDPVTSWGARAGIRYRF